MKWYSSRARPCTGAPDPKRMTERSCIHSKQPFFSTTFLPSNGNLTPLVGDHHLVRCSRPHRATGRERERDLRCGLPARRPTGLPRTTVLSPGTARRRGQGRSYYHRSHTRPLAVVQAQGGAAHTATPIRRAAGGLWASVNSGLAAEPKWHHIILTPSLLRPDTVLRTLHKRSGRHGLSLRPRPTPPFASVSRARTQPYANGPHMS